MNEWLDKMVYDGSFVGAVLQVIAASILGIAVYFRGVADRKQALTLAFDAEWNTIEMVSARRITHGIMLEKREIPKLTDKAFPEFWVVRMYLERAALAAEASLFDANLFRNIICRDAGGFAEQIHKAWGDDGISMRFVRVIGPSHSYLHQDAA